MTRIVDFRARMPRLPGERLFDFEEAGFKGATRQRLRPDAGLKNSRALFGGTRAGAKAACSRPLFSDTSPLRPSRIAPLPLFGRIGLPNMGGGYADRILAGAAGLLTPATLQDAGEKMPLASGWMYAYAGLLIVGGIIAVLILRSDTKKPYKPKGAKRPTTPPALGPSRQGPVSYEEFTKGNGTSQPAADDIRIVPPGQARPPKIEFTVGSEHPSINLSRPREPLYEGNTFFKTIFGPLMMPEHKDKYPGANAFMTRVMDCIGLDVDYIGMEEMVNPAIEKWNGIAALLDKQGEAVGIDDSNTVSIQKIVNADGNTAPSFLIKGDKYILYSAKFFYDDHERLVSVTIEKEEFVHAEPSVPNIVTLTKLDGNGDVFWLGRTEPVVRRRPMLIGPVGDGTGAADDIRIVPPGQTRPPALDPSQQHPVSYSEFAGGGAVKQAGKMSSNAVPVASRPDKPLSIIMGQGTDDWLSGFQVADMRGFLAHHISELHKGADRELLRSALDGALDAWTRLPVDEKIRILNEELAAAKKPAPSVETMIANPNLLSDMPFTAEHARDTISFKWVTEQLNGAPFLFRAKKHFWLDLFGIPAVGKTSILMPAGMHRMGQIERGQTPPPRKEINPILLDDGGYLKNFWTLCELKDDFRKYKIDVPKINNLPPNRVGQYVFEYTANDRTYVVVRGGFFNSKGRPVAGSIAGYSAETTVLADDEYHEITVIYSFLEYGTLVGYEVWRKTADGREGTGNVSESLVASYGLKPNKTTVLERAGIRESDDKNPVHPGEQQR